MPKTQALVALEAGKPYRLLEVDIPDDLGPNEVHVQIFSSGLCHTDLKAAGGGFHMTPPLIGGHEGAGKILAIGSAVTRVAVGDQVVLTFASCRNCRYCTTGHPAHCETVFDLNWGKGNRSNGGRGPRVIENGSEKDVKGMFFGQSSFSKIALVRENCCLKVNAKSEEELQLFAALGCGLSTGASTIWRLLNPAPSEAIVMIGVGAVGLAAIMAGASMRAGSSTSSGPLIAVDPIPQKREIALTLGATHAFPSLSAVREAFPKGVDAIIDGVGKRSILEEGFDLLAPLGRLVTIGSPDGPNLDVEDFPKLSITHILGSGKKWLGTHQGDSIPEETIHRLIQEYRAGKYFPLERICKRFRFEDFDKAVEEVHSGKVVKAILIW